MITNDRDHVRELGCQRTKEVRNNNKSKEIWQFKIPNIYFDAVDYIGMINYNRDILVTEQT